MKLSGFIDLALDWCRKHKEKILAAFAALGAVLGGIGLFSADKAGKKQKEAQIIYDEAYKRCKESERITNEAMNALGKLQINTMETFPRFIAAAELIGKQSKGLIKGISKTVIPKVDLKELKELSNSLDLALSGACGAGSGVAAGIAAFGVKAVALSPGVFVGGAVLCLKGTGFYKKAIENKRQALQAQKDAEKIIQFYDKLRASAEALNITMNEIYEIYSRHLSELEELAERMDERKKLTPDEELLVKNTARLAKLMKQMCEVNLVQKPKNEKEIETVNEKEVSRLIKLGNESIAAFSI